MHLIEFTEDDYPLLISWIPDEAFNFLWGGPLYRWPISVEQIRRQQVREGIKSFLLVSEQKKVGYIELCEESSDSCRLSRILVAEASARGKGYGQQLIKLAIEYAQNSLSTEMVTLVVFEHNERAIRCYKALGFQVTGRDAKSRKFDGQWWPLLHMEMTLSPSSHTSESNKEVKL